MSEKKSLLGSGLGMVLRNKRYIVWFYVLNVSFGLFGTAAFVNHTRAILDHSLQSDRLLHGFSRGVLLEMFSRPEFGPRMAYRMPAIFSALLFLGSTALFLPGVFQGYASRYRLPREDFFRACGRNLWRFIRLMIVAGIVMGIVAGIMLNVQDALVKQAEASTNEMLSVYAQIASLIVIFLVMTVLRIWFDLSEADIVLSDQRAVRKSIDASLRHTFRSLGRLFAAYAAATMVAAIVLLAGLWSWMKFVAPENVVGAFFVGQVTLLLLLIPRFWQRGVAVSYWTETMIVPVVAVRPLEPRPGTMADVSDGAPVFPVPPERTPES